MSAKIRGGIAFSAKPFGAIETIPLPKMVNINIGAQAISAVEVGDAVLKGQALTQPTNHVTMQHASLSGVVSTISNNTISISSDGLDQSLATEAIKNPTAYDIQRISQSHGLVGLGGAAFPLYKKFIAAKNQNSATTLKVDTLLINAAECDPAIYCDEALIQERSVDIIKGIELAITATGANQCLLGIEENKTNAIEELRKNLPTNIKLITVPAVYPSGAENTLYKLCTGKTGGLHANQSLCVNIATCYSLYRAVVLKEPLISRVVTVVINDTIRNFELRLGSPITDLLNHLNLDHNIDITCGGRMMGWPVNTNDVIGKRTNSLIFENALKIEPSACIRCGACADVCPENLLPQQLFWNSKPFNKPQLDDLKLADCIECGCCDIVCPSHIRLTNEFISAKEIIRQQAIEQENAQLAKWRYEKRLARLNNQSVRERQKLDDKTATISTGQNNAKAKKDLIAEALKRSKKRKSNNDSHSNQNRDNPL